MQNKIFKRAIPSFKNKYILAICFLFIFKFSFSNNPFIIDTTTRYVVNYMNLHIRPFIANHTMSVLINDKNNNGTEINYIPNVNTKLGISCAYKGVRLALTMRVEDPNKTDDIYGKTNYNDLRLYLLSRRVGIDAFYQKYKGFYIDNTQDFDTTWVNGNDYIKNSDLVLSSMGLNMFFVTNKNFSIKAAFHQTARQKRNAGSLLLMNSYIYSNFGDNVSIIPSDQKKFYADDSNFKGGDFYTIYLAPGYGYTFVSRNYFYITPVAFLGTGLQHQSYSLNNGLEKKFKPTLKLNLRGSVGYNSETFYVGLNFSLDNNIILLDNTNISMNTMAFEMSLGVRL